MMKLGFGLYKHLLTDDNFRFAKQCGATHLVVHLVDYFGKDDNNKERADQPIGGSGGWGNAGIGTPIWTEEYLVKLKKKINSHGLELEAIENFDPAHWYDILLDGPRKEEQIEDLKQLIRNVGAAGIPIFGYNFSIAGVSSRVTGSFARGGATSVGMEGIPYQPPIQKGMVWNMVYDPEAPKGTLDYISHETLWSRLSYFLNELVPVAEEVGVKLAAHPDDPPLPTLRQTPRLVYQPNMYQKLIDIKDSPSNVLEFCLGSIAEMSEGDVYEATKRYSEQQKIGYIHFRNVVGKVPNYKEVFVDEGDIDMLRILRILKENNFQGVLIPDHTPQMTCGSPWYAGMAFAMGYMKCALETL
jgi:mannonate dehydratase